MSSTCNVSTNEEHVVPAATVVGSPFQQRVHAFTSQGARGVERMHGEVYGVGPGCIVGEVQKVVRCPWYYLVTSIGMTWVCTRPNNLEGQRSCTCNPRHSEIATKWQSNLQL